MGISKDIQISSAITVKHLEVSLTKGIFKLFRTKFINECYRDHPKKSKKTTKK